MSYGGESNAKKIARAAAWQYMGKYCPDPRVLVLSGPDGHDVRAARAVGIRSTIVAVDSDGAALDQARRRCCNIDGVEWINDDVEGVLESRSFDIVFLDFCSPILLAAKRVARNIQRWECDEGDMFIMLGGMYGRDGRWDEGDDVSLRTDVRRALQSIRTLWAGGRLILPANGFSYTSSRTTETGGVAQTPMLYQSFMYSTRSLSRKLRRSARGRFFRSAFFRVLKTIDIGSDRHGTLLRKRFLEVAERDGSSKRAADLFAIDRGTAAAWLAVSTRERAEPRP